MEDNREKYEGDVKLYVPVSKKLENFWYHYKWHSIAVLSVILIRVIVAFQMCGRTSFDAHVLYAGYHEVKKTSLDGDTAPYKKMLDELESLASDVDGDGEAPRRDEYRTSSILGASKSMPVTSLLNQASRTV